MGWFNAPREHLLAWCSPGILGGVLLFFVMLVFFVAISLVHVLTKDFVVPLMALEGIGAVEGWRRLWPMLEAEKAGYAVYVLMKIVLAIGAGIVVAIASIVLVLIVMIPAAGLGIIAVITGKTAGLTWNVLTITIAVVAACILLAVFMFLMALISVPVLVFFPAYSIYFFAARYRALSAVLYPPPSPLGSAGGPPPDEPPPPLDPLPEPIG